jgi:hypothetical protein
MRFDHFHGLNKAGRSLVSRRLGCHQIVMRVWPDGRSETIESDSIPLVEKVEVLGQVRGFYRRSIGLRQRYHLVGGRVLDEFLQLGCKNNHWHSGPHYGLALREQDGSAVESVALDRREDGAAGALHRGSEPLGPQPAALHARRA